MSPIRPIARGGRFAPRRSMKAGASAPAISNLENAERSTRPARSRTARHSAATVSRQAGRPKVSGAARNPFSAESGGSEAGNASRDPSSADSGRSKAGCASRGPLPTGSDPEPRANQFGRSQPYTQPNTAPCAAWTGWIGVVRRGRPAGRSSNG